MTIQPRKLIMGLLLASKGQSVFAKDLVTACEIFGVAQGSTRVALARLTAENQIQSTARGVYTLGKAAKNIGLHVSNWKNQIQSIRPWSGLYLVAYTNHMGRTNRTVLKQRESAMELMGFRELEQGLFVRPDNIEKNLDAVKDRLVKLGVAPNCHLFTAKQFQAHTLQEINNLWSPDELIQQYHQQVQHLKQWIAQHSSLSLEVAAKESYLLGSKVIRMVRHDPLLPDEMIDASIRQEFFDVAIEMDNIGQAIWQQFHNKTIGQNIEAGFRLTQA